MRTDEYFVPEADDRQQAEQPLSQEELEAWWPFKRLEPNRFPKHVAAKTNHLEDIEDAPF